MSAADERAKVLKAMQGRCDENIGSTTESLAQTVLGRS